MSDIALKAPGILLKKVEYTQRYECLKVQIGDG